MPTGTIKMWGKGWGYIKPDDGSEDVFCHCSALGGAQPQPGVTVSYEVEHDERRGKYRASKAEVTGRNENFVAEQEKARADSFAAKGAGKLDKGKGKIFGGCAKGKYDPARYDPY
mmetsp:Transcript_119348/g.207179  ORF Transcript_119348/g.207179 Transcript_119348/m.207179 type:complete len:115 (+) Transcript_119348:65-409(+)